MLAFLPVWILVAKLAGLYDADHRAMRHLTVDEAPAIFAWGVVGAVAASLLGGLTPAGSLDTAELVGVALVAVAADFVLRVAARAALAGEHSAGAGADRRQRAASRTAMRRKLALFSDLHMEALEQRRLTAAGSTGSSSRTSASTRARSRRSSSSATATRRSSAWSRRSAARRPRTTISRLAELPVFEYVTSDVSRSTMMLKRALDLIVGIPLAILTAPLLFPLIALAIWLEDRGPILFVQRRAGPERRAVPAAQVPDHARRAPTARSRTCSTSCPSRCSSSGRTRA